ncbi:Holliday junction branch migration protein RuvA [Halobacteriovorax sp. RT-2-6]|uniref:Holliday junction branch migration protein RuvA n=1 Tax=unclassified Halobacteriovorax TaxID=2639665 RepID=UPI00399B9DAB
MIGLLQGEVVFSDGNELILFTPSGVGHQIYFQHVLPEGSVAAIFISHIVKEASEELFGFRSLREKKTFELLLSVKGVGPKGAFALVTSIGVDNIIDAITFDNKKTLQKAPGVGAKAASQIILDLSGKAQKIKMYSKASASANQTAQSISQAPLNLELFEESVSEVVNHESALMNDAIMACKELGFTEDKVMPLAKRILDENQITRAEQLVHLVLKEV